MEHYDIFHACFPSLSFGSGVFSEISEIGKSEIFTAIDGDKTVGFAAVKGNDLRILCVLPEYRKKGYGTELFRKAEQYAVSYGHSELNIGGRGSGLFIGTTLDSAGFFEKQGCSFGENIAEMGGITDRLSSVPYPENASFGLYGGDREKLKKAVAAVEEDWPQYFDDCEVMCGYVDGNIASFCTVEDDEACLLSDGKSRIGSIGCVGTLPECRRRGIGLKAVSLAAGELKRRGCDKIFIHYTAVYNWYAKLGFETFLWVRLGGKKLK